MDFVLLQRSSHPRGIQDAEKNNRMVFMADAGFAATPKMGVVVVAAAAKDTFELIIFSLFLRLILPLCFLVLAFPQQI